MPAKSPSRFSKLLDWLFPTSRAARRNVIAMVEEHRVALDQLTARLEQAQKAKVDAEKRADDLRDEKDRLRERTRALKKELAEATNKGEILGERVTALQNENQRLVASEFKKE